MIIKESIYEKVTIWHKIDDEDYWHREDGPAAIRIDGEEYREVWYYYDTVYLPSRMPLNLFLSYCKWEYRKNGN